MPSKSTSPEAAQKKLWKAEIRSHQTAARKVRADFKAERNRLIANCNAAEKALSKFSDRAEKQLPKQLSAIESRIAILNGRLGI